MATPASHARRNELIGAAYAMHAERLHRMVERSSAPEHRDLAQDACSFAWQKLVVRNDIAIGPDERYLGWLFTVARHEHWRLVRESRRELSLDATQNPDDTTDRSSLASGLRSLGDLHASAEQLEQLQLLAELPPARRQALLLLGAGHSYAEIGSLMGLTQTQVNRYLAEGRKKIRDLDRQRSEASLPAQLRSGRGREASSPELVPPPTRDLELGLGS